MREMLGEWFEAGATVHGTLLLHATMKLCSAAGYASMNSKN